jgi:hypothetical protein
MPRIVKYNIVERSGTKQRSAPNALATKHVIVTDQPATIGWISKHPRTPKLNTEVDGHPGLYWDKVDPRQVGRLIWELDCAASPFVFDPIPESPLARPAEITVDSELLAEPTLFDYKNRPLVTKAGEFIAGVQRERPLLVYRVTKNLAQDPAWLDNYPGCVNEDPVRLRGRVRAKGTLMLRRLSLSSYVREHQYRYCTCSFELHYDPLGWIKKLWNLGTLQLVEFKDERGRKAFRQERIMAGKPLLPVDEPVPLDMQGRPLKSVLDPTQEIPLDATKMVVLKYDVQPLVKFTGILPLV